MDEEVEASPVAKRTPWPIGLHSIEEQRKREEEERERETRQQQHEGQQQPQQQEGEGEEGRRLEGARLEELLEQDRQEELRELQEQQQQQRSQQLEGLLEPPPHNPPQPVPPTPQEPETGEKGLPVYGPPTLAWLCPGAPSSIPVEPRRADGVVALACMMRTPVDPQSEIKGTVYGIEGIAPRFLQERRLWDDHKPSEEDEAGTSGGGASDETGT